MRREKKRGRERMTRNIQINNKNNNSSNNNNDNNKNSSSKSVKDRWTVAVGKGEKKKGDQRRSF